MSSISPQDIIPELGNDRHKGQGGRIGVIGGCKEYTGAPYYAGMAALRTGADIVQVFCSKDASIPIKSYTPELIVHGCLFEEEKSEDEQGKALKEITKWIKSLHALVIGSGLGRNPHMWKMVSKIIEAAKKEEMPIVIDGDGVGLVMDHGMAKYPLCILTPNSPEYLRLLHHHFPHERDSPHTLSLLSSHLGCIILRKGSTDHIGAPEMETGECSARGSPRRCGGQGDFLAGSLGTFAYWAVSKAREQKIDVSKPSPDLFKLMMAASMGAACLVRKSSQLAFSKHFRATTTPDILKSLGPAFQELWPYS